MQNKDYQTLRECPFCGRKPKVTKRVDSLDGFFCAIACFCGGYSSRAYQMATARTELDAYKKAIAAWNHRTKPDNKLPYKQRDLILELKKLRAELANVKAERDAAIADISCRCRFCRGCENREKIEPIHDGCPIFQWRGRRDTKED